MYELQWWRFIEKFGRKSGCYRDKIFYRNLPKVGSREDIHQKLNEKTATPQYGILFGNKKQ